MKQRGHSPTEAKACLLSEDCRCTEGGQVSDVDMTYLSPAINFSEIWVKAFRPQYRIRFSLNRALWLLRSLKVARSMVGSRIPAALKGIPPKRWNMDTGPHHSTTVCDIGDGLKISRQGVSNFVLGVHGCGGSVLRFV